MSQPHTKKIDPTLIIAVALGVILIGMSFAIMGLSNDLDIANTIIEDKKGDKKDNQKEKKDNQKEEKAESKKYLKECLDKVKQSEDTKKQKRADRKQCNIDAKLIGNAK